MRERKLFIALYIVLALEGMAVFSALLATENDPANAWWLGISKTRALLAIGVLAVVIGFGALYYGARKGMRFEGRVSSLASRAIHNNSGYLFLGAIFCSLLLVALYLLILSGQIGDNLVRVRLERLRPLLIWAALIAYQGWVALPLLRYGQERRPLGLPAGVGRPWLWAGAFFTGLVLFAWISRLGIAPDKVGWDNPGAPLLFAQLVLLIATIVLMRKIFLWWLAKRAIQTTTTRIDVLLTGVIWLAAVGLWLSAPIEQTYFSPHPRAPNFEFYPYSDAGLHDIAAQNLILGEGYVPLAEKPLYSLFLAASHLLVGQDYQAVVNLQTILLAFFPAVIFLLATRMFSRTAGVIAAAAIILREWNTISLSPQIRVSHSKLLMTDLPAAFLISIFIALSFRWLSNQRQDLNTAILAGGSLGLVLLVRSQAVVFIPLVLLAVVMVDWRRWRAALIQGTVFTISVFIVIVPWMLRNYQITGVFGYSQPNQALYIAKQYSLTPEEADPGFPEEATLEEYTSLGFAKMLAFTRQYPQVVARFVGSHFMRNEISALLIFPVAISDVALDNAGPRFFDVDPFVWDDCCSLKAFMNRLPFWQDWEGSLSIETAAMMAANLLVISLGVAAAWKRWRLLGLMPLALHFAYSLSVAIARVSGWRLILPADWIVVVYYCIGLSVLLAWAGAYSKGTAAAHLEQDRAVIGSRSAKMNSGRFTWKAAGLLLLFGALGSIVPMAELVFPQRYPLVTTAEQVHAMPEFSGLAELFPGLEDFMAEPAAVAAVGRALYPRYYREGQFEPGGKWPGNIEFPAPRLAFYLAGPSYSQVVLPLPQSPEYFPNAVDVALLGCRQEGFIHAFAVVVFSEAGDYVYFNSLPVDQTCASVDE